MRKPAIVTMALVSAAVLTAAGISAAAARQGSPGAAPGIVAPAAAVRTPQTGHDHPAGPAGTTTDGGTSHVGAGSDDDGIDDDGDGTDTGGTDDDGTISDRIPESGGRNGGGLRDLEDGIQQHGAQQQAVRGGTHDDRDS